MPNCFQLISKQTGEPEKFGKIDDEMRVYFNQPPDDKNWYCNWYDIIGFRLALGQPFEKIRADFEKESWTELVQIVDYLVERYDSNSWYDPHK